MHFLTHSGHFSTYCSSGSLLISEPVLKFQVQSHSTEYLPDQGYPRVNDVMAGQSGTQILALVVTRRASNACGRTNTVDGVGGVICHLKNSEVLESSHSSQIFRLSGIYSNYNRYQ